MSYGVEVYNSDGIKIISDGETSYYVAKEGTLSPDASGTTVTDFSNVSSLSYAYFIDDTYLVDYSSNVSTWSSSTSYNEFDLVVKSGSATAGTKVYEAVKDNSGNDPNPSNSAYNYDDWEHWRTKVIRDNYDRTNDALYSEIEGQNAIIFFKLPSVGDVITRVFPYGVRYWQDDTIPLNAIDFEVPILSNRSTLDYAIVRPLSDFTPSVSGYGMQVYDASGNTIHVTSEKLAHIDNFANQLGINSTITSSSSAVNWVGIPFYFYGRSKGDYNSASSGLYFSNYIKRDTSTNWKHQVDTFSAGQETFGNPNGIYINFFIGRFD